MRIVYYSPHPTHDIVSEVGYATHQREVINALKALGHEVIPVIMGGTEKDNLSAAGIPAPKGSMKAIFKRLMPRFIWTSLKDFQLMQHDKKASRKLEEAIIRFQPDLVYERSEYLQDGAVEVIKKHRIKYFIEVNAPFTEEMKGFEGYSIWHSLAHRKESRKNKAALKIFVVSSSLKKFIVDTYNIHPEKIFVQPNCINLEMIHTNPERMDQLKKAFNISEKKVIGFVGSIFPHHGVDILIDAFEIVLRGKPDSMLLIVGDGSIIGNLKERVRVKALSGNVVFAGKQVHDEVFNFIGLMDICVMAKSNWYGSPIKIFEYGAMGKPVIAPNTAPVRDVMENEIHGLLVEMNKEEVAKAILRFLDNKSLAKDMADNFKNRIIEAYTWENAAGNIVDSLMHT